MFERNIINKCYSDNAFEARDFTRRSTFQFVAGPMYIFRTKLPLKILRLNMIVTPLNFQDNLLCVFADFQQKVQSQKYPITY